VQAGLVPERMVKGITKIGDVSEYISMENLFT
jgi:hypothetical protein